LSAAAVAAGRANRSAVERIISSRMMSSSMSGITDLPRHGVARGGGQPRGVRATGESGVLGRGKERAETGLLAKLRHGARQGAPDGSRCDAEQLRDLVLAAVVEIPQHDDFPLVRGQRAQRAEQRRAQLDGFRRIGGPRIAVVVPLGQPDLGDLALLHAPLVDHDVVHHPPAERPRVVHPRPAAWITLSGYPWTRPAGHSVTVRLRTRFRERPVGEYELFTLGVAIAVVMIIGRSVASRLEVPDAIILVILGVLASLIPQVPNIDLPPNVVLFLFLPPLVYNAAFLSAPRETRENAVPITALSVGTTAVTNIGVGAVTRVVLPQVGWPGALAFAAAVAPTDAVAATSVLTRLGAPTRVVTILEGESLINDGVALTAFGLAVEAMAHPFTFAHGVVRLVEVVVGGVAYGVAVALVIGRVRHFVRDPMVQILVTLITPFAAYVPAEELHVSGVLATVV